MGTRPAPKARPPVPPLPQVRPTTLDKASSRSSSAASLTPRHVLASSKFRWSVERPAPSRSARYGGSGQCPSTGYFRAPDHQFPPPLTQFPKSDNAAPAWRYFLSLVLLPRLNIAARAGESSPPDERRRI